MRRLSFLLGLCSISLACGEEPTTDSAADSSETGSGSETQLPPQSESTDSEESGPTETGETGAPAVCGDGNLDPGEACDDGNTEPGDGCTEVCEIGPCGFVWTSRELVLSGGFEVRTPTSLDGPDLVVAHQLAEQAQMTGLTRATATDGAVYASETLDFGTDSSVPDAMAIGPDGEVYIASANKLAGTVSIRQLNPDDGSEIWVVMRPSEDRIRDLAWSPSGELLLLNTIDAGVMNQDAELAALDPQDGSELWAHNFGGLPADNGFSTDSGAALVVDDTGRAYVAYNEFLAWDTLAPTVAAFAPGGAAEPLWTTRVHEVANRQLEVMDLAIGPDGTLAVGFMRWDGSQKFWVAALEPETGALEWRVERDDFDVPNLNSSLRSLAVSDERVLATGSWLTDVDGIEVRQGYVLGLGLDGALTCVGTIDDLDPGETASVETHLPLELLTAPDGGFWLSGYVNRFTLGEVDLVLAYIR